MGIVEKVEGGRVHTIEGNRTDRVARFSYSLSSNEIYGYAKPNYATSANNQRPRNDYEKFVGEVQKAIGASVDYIAGPETLDKTPTVSISENRNHRVVTALERYLKKLGYYNGEIEADKGKTPIFGNGMKEAVKKYQRAMGLRVVDGIITAKANTWKKLLKLA